MLQQQHNNMQPEVSKLLSDNIGFMFEHNHSAIVEGSLSDLQMS